MDSNVDCFIPKSDPATADVFTEQKNGVVTRSANRSRPAPRKRSTRTKRRMGREAIKAGMAATLTMSMLTGMRVIKPMKLHGPFSWAFVGLTLAHTLIYEIPNKKTR